MREIRKLTINGKPIPEGLVLNKWFASRFNSNRNCLICIIGGTGCLIEDTKLLGQEKTIGELYNAGSKFVDTISINQAKGRKDGCFYPIKSKSEIIPSGEKEVYEIELENGEKVLTTEDHKFFRFNKGKREEVQLKNMNIGDNMVCYPKDYAKNYYSNCNSKEKTKRRLKFNPKRICEKCGNLYFINCEQGKTSKKYCNNCSENFGTIGKGRWRIPNKNKKYHKRMWFEWEDNLIRQFYSSWKKDKILELMPRRNWDAISHRAERLGIKRDIKFRFPVFSINKMTSIEKKMADLLDSLNIPYEFNKIIKTKSSFKIPDFKIGNTLIECDGIHWHQQRKNDEKRDKELKNLGFEIIRFTDKEINNNLEEVKKCIAQKLNL